MNDFADKKTSGGCLNLQEVTNQLMTFLRSRLLSSHVPSCRPLGRGKKEADAQRYIKSSGIEEDVESLLCREFSLALLVAPLH